MRAILIDSTTQEIKEVELTAPTLKSMYKHLDCELVDLVRLDDKADMYVDDEGLLKDPKSFFQIQYDGIKFQPIAGKGLICSHDDEGDTAGLPTDHPITVEFLKQNVTWAHAHQVLEMLGE